MALMIDGKKVPKLAIGTWAWGDGMNGSRMIFGQKTDKEEIAKAFEKAVLSGFDLWDTAAVYGGGRSEKILGEFCEGKEIILSTKFTPIGKDSLESIRKSLAESMSRLKREKPDIYWIHTSHNWVNNLENMIILLKEGKIGSIGLSNFSLEKIIAAEKRLEKEGFHIGGVQNHYSLIYRDSEKTGIIKWCQERNIPFFAYMTLEQGALTGRYNSANPFPLFSRRGLSFTKKTLKKLEPLHEALLEVGRAYALNIADTAIVWAITKGTVPIIGVTKAHHANNLKTVASLRLTAEEVAYLDKIAEQTGVTKAIGCENRD